MIVKNEAAILRETLGALRPIVDEWVIVDTGSTDGTQAIISEYGPVTELAFEDFVTTKNKALALATGKYILFMDADERLLAGAEKLRAVAEAGEWDGLSVASSTGRRPTRWSRNMTGCGCGATTVSWRLRGRGCTRSSGAPAGTGAA